MQTNTNTQGPTTHPGQDHSSSAQVSSSHFKVDVLHLSIFIQFSLSPIMLPVQCQVLLLVLNKIESKYIYRIFGKIITMKRKLDKVTLKADTRLYLLFAFVVISLLTQQ